MTEPSPTLNRCLNCGGPLSGAAAIGVVYLLASIPAFMLVLAWAAM